MIGVACTTPGTARMRVSARSSFGSAVTRPVTCMWPLKPRMRSSSSLLNPFITDMTMMRIATASMMRMKEMVEISATPPSLRRARR